MTDLRNFVVDIFDKFLIKLQNIFVRRYIILTLNGKKYVPVTDSKTSDKQKTSTFRDDPEDEGSTVF
jgi:hypothetical protein